MRFRDVVGQQWIKEMLVNSVEHNRVSHALLFSGRSGYGSLTLALAYAQYLNCTNRREGDSCGECPSCHQMEKLQHPDIHIIYPEAGPEKERESRRKLFEELFVESKGYFSEIEWQRKQGLSSFQDNLIKRERADEINKVLSFKTFQSKYKVMVIWLPETMHVAASNAILKVLEEPWQDTVFLMVSEEPEKLLPTIYSRLQEVNVAGVGQEEIAHYLSQNQALTPKERESIARVARGDLIVARRLSQDKSGKGGQFFEFFVRLMRLSFLNDHMELLKWADEMAELGREQQMAFVDYAVAMLRENYMLNAGMESITYLTGDEMEFSENFSPYIGNHNIETLIEEFEKAKLHVRHNGNPKMIFPHFALEVSKHIGRR